MDVFEPVLNSSMNESGGGPQLASRTPRPTSAPFRYRRTTPFSSRVPATWNHSLDVTLVSEVIGEELPMKNCGLCEVTTRLTHVVLSSWTYYPRRYCLFSMETSTRAHASRVYVVFVSFTSVHIFACEWRRAVRDVAAAGFHGGDAVAPNFSSISESHASSCEGGTVTS